MRAIARTKLSLGVPMRWTLIALLSGQPVPTGVFFGKHYECL